MLIRRLSARGHRVRIRQWNRQTREMKVSGQRKIREELTSIKKTRRHGHTRRRRESATVNLPYAHGETTKYSKCVVILAQVESIKLIIILLNVPTTQYLYLHRTLRDKVADNIMFMTTRDVSNSDLRYRLSVW